MDASVLDVGFVRELVVFGAEPSEAFFVDEGDKGVYGGYEDI